MKLQLPIEYQYRKQCRARDQYDEIPSQGIFVQIQGRHAQGYTQDQQYVRNVRTEGIANGQSRIPLPCREGGDQQLGSRGAKSQYQYADDICRNVQPLSQLRCTAHHLFRAPRQK